MSTITKIQELYLIRDKLTVFEKGFVSDNVARVEKWEDETRFSEKQEKLVDRIYKERIVEGKPASTMVNQE